ncbi:hypothetical protein ACFL6C_07815 [Myxococcota bacterium]
MVSRWRDRIRFLFLAPLLEDTNDVDRGLAFSLRAGRVFWDNEWSSARVTLEAMPTLYQDGLAIIAWCVLAEWQLY